MYKITATKTYDEVCTSDNTIEAGLVNFGYPQSTVDALREWFGTRIVCDDKNFKLFYHRLARQFVKKYKAQLRIESIDAKFDPLVENYKEDARYIGTDGQKTLAGTSKDISPVEYQDTHRPAEYKDTKVLSDTILWDRPYEYEKKETPAGIQQTKQYAGYKDVNKHGLENEQKGRIVDTDSGYSEDETITDADSKRLDRANPMSATSVGIGNGISGGRGAGSEIDRLDWSTSSAQSQQTQGTYQLQKHDASGLPTHTQEYEGYVHKTSGTDENERSYTGQDVLKTTPTTNASEILKVKREGKKSLDHENPETIERQILSPETTKHELLTSGHEEINYKNPERSKEQTMSYNIVTGRAGTLPQDALRKAIDYLQTSSPAFFDLLEKLEPAFLGVYEI